MLTVTVVKIIYVSNATQVFIWITDIVIAVTYSLTASAVQAVICASNVKLVFILIMEFVKLVANTVLNVAVLMIVTIMVTLAQSVIQVILFKKTSAIDVKSSVLHAQN